MNQPDISDPETSTVVVDTNHGKVKRRPIRFLKFLKAILLWPLLTLLSLGSVSSFLVNGWLVGITRKGTIHHLRKVSGQRSDTQTEDEAERTGGHAAIRLWRSISMCAVRGFRNWFGVMALTVPGLGLLSFAWYAGWQVSFTKMYEYSGVGFFTWLAGTLWLAVILPLVIMGMARYALSGDWKLYFQIRRNLRWVRRAGWRNVSTVLLFLVASLPVGINYFIFYFWPDIINLPVDAGPEEMKAIVNRFYFLASLLLMMPVWLATRYAVGRHLLAPTVVSWVKSGRVAPSDLTDREWQVLSEYGVHQLRDESDLTALKKLGRVSGRGMRWSGLGVSVFLWFIFGFLISLAQFGRYSGLEGWFNHPMIHNPHYHFSPSLDSTGENYIRLSDSPAFRD